jgi:dTDP-3-amino-3,4,6-trideoxy-alpha-D-glucose transaminase
VIVLNDFKRQWDETRGEAMRTFEAVGSSGWYILGREVAEFEAALAREWGLRHCVGVASGLDALEIGLKVLGCMPGDRVLTTPLSAFATTLAIVKAGGVPVFVDVDRFGLIDLDACGRIMNRMDVRFAIPVHLYGHALDLSKLAALRRDFGLRIVEDCAQSIGASFRGHPTGSVGELAATSFYPTKNLGAMGDGGAILTDDDSWRDAARYLRDYGQTAKYRHDVIGYNSRLDELQAALMNHVYLPLEARWLERRRTIAQRYLDGLRNERIDVPGAPDGSESGWHLFPVHIAAQRKPDFIAHLRSRDVMTGEHYPIAIPDQLAMAAVAHESDGELSRARMHCRTEVSIPIHPYLTDDEVDAVVDACNAWHG